jgi:hypothetical protein
VSQIGCRPCWVGIAVITAATGKTVTLTRHVGWEDSGPAWCPDGSRIAFSRTTDGSRSFQIYFAFLTNRTEAITVVEAEHRDHAVVEQVIVDLKDRRAARTLRLALLQIAGRLTRHGRSWTLHLPARWPWQGDYLAALARVRALPAA